MTQTLRMDPGADVEAVVKANAREYGESGWAIRHTEEADGTLFVTVEWESEKHPIAYLRRRDAMTTRDADLLIEAIEHGSYRAVEQESGNWSIYRDKSFREGRP